MRHLTARCCTGTWLWQHLKPTPNLSSWLLFPTGRRCLTKIDVRDIPAGDKLYVSLDPLTISDFASYVFTDEMAHNALDNFDVSMACAHCEKLIGHVLASSVAVEQLAAVQEYMACKTVYS